MRILPLASNPSYKNNVSFKADVVVLPSAARGSQPSEDKFILERETQKVKEELQRRFPSKDDNIQIFLQPTGFNSPSDKKSYWNQITAFLGYKDPERARQDMLKRSIDPPNDDYVELEPETIQKLKNKDSALMKKLGQKVDFTSTNYLKDDIEPNIKLHFIDDVEELIHNELDYGLTEFEKQPVTPISNSSYDTTDYYINGF